MSSKIKNIIIYGVVGIVLILLYVFLIRKSPEQQNLVSVTPPDTDSSAVDTLSKNSSISKDLLSVLLSVKSIKLDDSIFSDKAFINLRDSTIVLAPPSPEEQGRPNPFAPIGTDAGSNTAPVETLPETTLSLPSSTISVDATLPTGTIGEDVMAP